MNRLSNDAKPFQESKSLDIRISESLNRQKTCGDSQIDIRQSNESTKESDNSIKTETKNSNLSHYSETIYKLPEKLPPLRRKAKEIGMSNLVEADTNYLNFGVFYPGKIFKCNLSLTNITDHTHTVFVTFDHSSRFTQSQFLRSSPENSLPDKLEYPMENSELAHNCWHFMLSPSNKTFEKSFTVDLPPHEAIQFGVVIKSPCTTRAQKFFSAVKVELAEEDLMSQLLSRGKNSIYILSEAEIMTPKLECCKELMHEQTGLKIIPLVVKCDSEIQRVKIPFKNTGTKDLELILKIFKYPSPDDKEESESIADSRCMPNIVKIQSGSTNFISICVSQITKDIQGKKEQKVLVAKIKDTLMVYSYILEYSYIP